MKFYIASKLENYKQVRNLAELLTNFVWEHTYDWTVYGLNNKIDVKTLYSASDHLFCTPFVMRYE